MAIYLFFDGTARAALDFYAETLGGEVGTLMRFADVPPGPDMPPVPAQMQDRLMHGVMRFDDQVIMASDTMQDDAATEHKGFFIQISRDTPEAARAIFEALAAGGEITMPFAETFWAKGFGLCSDRFGIRWMVNCDK